MINPFDLLKSLKNMQMAEKEMSHTDAGLAPQQREEARSLSLAQQVPAYDSGPELARGDANRDYAQEKLDALQNQEPFQRSTLGKIAQVAAPVAFGLGAAGVFGRSKGAGKMLGAGIKGASQFVQNEPILHAQQQQSQLNRANEVAGLNRDIALGPLDAQIKAQQGAFDYGQERTKHSRDTVKLLNESNRVKATLRNSSLTVWDKQQAILKLAHLELEKIKVKYKDKFPDMTTGQARTLLQNIPLIEDTIDITGSFLASELLTQERQSHGMPYGEAYNLTPKGRTPFDRKVTVDATKKVEEEIETEEENLGVGTKAALDGARTAVQLITNKDFSKATINEIRDYASRLKMKIDNGGVGEKYQSHLTSLYLAIGRYNTAVTDSTKAVDRMKKDKPSAIKQVIGHKFSVMDDERMYNEMGPDTWDALKANPNYTQEDLQRLIDDMRAPNGQ